jgi:thiol-disulfide isomerase/thioredoxin
MKRLFIVSAILVCLSANTKTESFDFGRLNAELGLEQNSISSKCFELTLVEFWASWCAPCRTQNLQLQELLDSLPANKLQVVGVSLDADSLRWRKAIRNDKLTWNHQYRLVDSWQSPLVNQLNIRKLPANFLVNNQGEIVSIDVTAGRVKGYMQ